MITCGLKLTHDGGIAIIENDKLLYASEIEKFGNSPRYSKLDNFDVVLPITSKYAIDRFVIDGWKGGVIKDHPDISVAPYHQDDGASLLHRKRGLWYDSYSHALGHIIGSYVTSNFYPNPAYVIVWDGGQQPALYYVDPTASTPVEFVTVLFNFFGSIYNIMGLYYGPYKIPPSQMAMPRYAPYGVPGKLMSYIAKGHVDEFLLSDMVVNYRELSLSFNPSFMRKENDFEHNFMERLHGIRHDDATVLLTLHTFLERMLVEIAIDKIPVNSNLIFTGGSALNIKWNSALRESEYFADVWVPPFPNDSGSAIGAAACAGALQDGVWKLDWSVYCGPSIPDEPAPVGWKKAACRLHELVDILVNEPHEPIVLLNGRAEIGPRALGNRSIIASAIPESNKTLLNKMKNREEFRPVAPICLEQYAPEIFAPGTPDPYMLFDHMVRSHWLGMIPAVVHLDTTARLQTVNEEQNDFIFRLLSLYREHTGIPLLCNTSANYNGKGFFPDVRSAAEWGQTKYIYSDGYLYTKEA